MAVDSHPISVQDLSKTYRIPVRDPGLRAALKSVVRRRTEEVEAVKEISFEVTSGEIVGFLGPNGAGKTTTLKMMSGLLNPSGGAVTVLGAEPFKRERSILRQITHVLEGRSETVLGSLGVNAPTPTAEGTPIPHRYAVCGVD
jgi:ABC-2 type transport system ATP-binding protein